MAKKSKAARTAAKRTGLGLLAVALLALGLYLSGGTREYRGAQGVEAQLAESRALLEAMEAREPVDLNAELKRLRRERLAAQNGILVDDLAAEQQRILALTEWSAADLTRWFDGTAIMGDSIIRQTRLFHYLDAPVFAEGGIHLSVELDMLDQVEAAAPSVIFMCFGMNDVGVFEERVDRYIGRYSACIRRLQISLPEAVIYVQAILPVTEKALKEHGDYQYIDLYNAEMEKMCRELGAYYVDASFILESMPELYAPDGVHPRREYYPMWLTYLADIAGLSNEQQSS